MSRVRLHRSQGMKPYATLDLETDPFLFNRRPRPFAAGFHSRIQGSVTEIREGPACCIDIVNLALSFPGYVYLHNGGKFDLHFLLPSILARYNASEVQPLCIGSRMVQIKTPICIFRDSYALIPKPLKTFGNKKDIDIWKLEENLYYNDKLCLYSKEIDFEERRFNAEKEGRNYTREHDARENYNIFLSDLKKQNKNLCHCPSPRRFYRNEIISYLKQDCVGLYDGLTEFFERYGMELTLASIAFKVLKKQFNYEQVNTKENYDDKFRPYYYAGRVQFYKLGKCETPGGYKIADINSAFSHAMLQPHWYSSEYRATDKISPEHKNQSFYDITCDSNGALPSRGRDKSVDFPKVKKHRFFATGWELFTGIDLGLISNVEYHVIYVPDEVLDFAPYVDYFYKLKSDADLEIKHLKQNKDTLPKDEYDSRLAKANADRDFAKLFLNSLYGKFALNPREFRDVKICRNRDECPDDVIISTKLLKQIDEHKRNTGHDPKGYYTRKDVDGVLRWHKKVWEHSYEDPESGINFWQRPSHGPEAQKPLRFYNVCTAASVTGCVRAYLARSMAKCGDVIYCDTDSIIAADISALEIGSGLGQWKLEKDNQTVWLGGKKLYACRGVDKKWKKASKGVRLSAGDIVDVCEGIEKSYSFDAPNFSVFSKSHFTTRRVNRDDKRKKRTS